MAAWRSALLVAAIAVGCLPGDVQGVMHRSKLKANPIRKVVNLLKNMEKKVKVEGDQSKKIFNKYMCYCKTTRAQLDSQITAAQEKIPQVESKLKEASGSLQQLKGSLTKAKEDRAAAQEAIKTATALREKAAATFDQENSDMKENIQAMGAAVAAITKGTGGFLQTKGASILSKLVVDMDMNNADRDLLSTFLQGGNKDADGSQGAGSGEIVGILKQMKETMSADLAEMTATENGDIKNFEELSVAKKREIAALTKDIELKTGRVGDVGVEIASLNADLEDTQEAMAEDQEFDKNMAVTCANKKAKYTGYTKKMSAELVALADTIKMLNDDDALDLFKKTLPSASLAQQNEQGLSFLQEEDSEESSEEDVRQKAVDSLRRPGNGNGDPRLSALELALRGGGKGKGFDGVQKKVDELIVIMGEEQVQDDDKIQYCKDEIDKTEDEMKQAERGAADRQTIISESEGLLATLIAEIEGLVSGIKSLDAEVDAQTVLRKEKASQVQEILAADNAAKGLIEVASKRLKDFYHQVDLAQMSANQEGSEERVGGAGDSVIQLLDSIRNDLGAGIAGLTAQDAQAQKDYEHFVGDSAAKRKIDSQAIADKEADKADLETRLHKDRNGLKIEKLNVAETKKELAALHDDCDWLAKNYDVRKSARADEVDALKKAKAVLAGANFS